MSEMSIANMYGKHPHNWPCFADCCVLYGKLQVSQQRLNNESGFTVVLRIRSLYHSVTEITHFQLLHSNILSYHHKPIKLYVSIYLWLLSGDMWYNWVLMNKSNPLQVINNLIVAYRNIQTKVFTMPFVTSIIWCVAINLWIYLICVNFWKIRNMTRWASAKRIWQVTWH